MAPSWWVRSISSTDGSTPVPASQKGSQNFQWRKEKFDLRVYFSWISPRTLYERIVQAVKNAGVTTEQVKQCENGRSMVAGSVSSILR